MNGKNIDNNDDAGFFAKHGVVIVVVASLLVLGIGLFVCFFSGKIAAPKKPQEIVIHLEPPPPLPPPPPPPPPKEPPPPEQKMVEQPPVNKPEEKPKEQPKAPDHPPASPGPVASGSPSDFGLAGSGGDGGYGNGGGGGSKYGWYAEKVQEAIAQALRKNSTTRDAILHLKVRIWSDAYGRVTNAALAGSSGDPSVDAAIKNEVLTGLRLPDGLPSDMPMPIVLRLNAKRPN